jgi:hypothetical protein
VLKQENHCCDCASPGYPCLGDTCPLIDVPVHYCDKCGEELPADEIYEVDGEELCEECLKDMFRRR